MKTDQSVSKMFIGAEVPVAMDKACALFIRHLITFSWALVKTSGRKTITKSDIIAAISKSEMYDFLIDIVPREVIISQKLRQVPVIPLIQQPPSVSQEFLTTIKQFYTDGNTLGLTLEQIALLTTFQTQANKRQEETNVPACQDVNAFNDAA